MDERDDAHEPSSRKHVVDHVEARATQKHASSSWVTACVFASEKRRDAQSFECASELVPELARCSVGYFPRAFFALERVSRWLAYLE